MFVLHALVSSDPGNQKKTAISVTRKLAAPVTRRILLLDDGLPRADLPSLPLLSDACTMHMLDIVMLADCLDAEKLNAMTFGLFSKTLVFIRLLAPRGPT